MIAVVNQMDIETLHQRNARVEADKAWEQSWTRRVLIAAMTYIVVSAYQIMLGMPKFYLHAFVPAGGYLISTFSLPVFKHVWLEKIHKH